MSESSVVWDFFTLNVETGRVKCGLSHNRSSTSNMMRHMRLKHVTVDLNSRRRQNVVEVSEEQVDDPDIPEQGVSNSSRVSYLNLFQCKIYAYIKKKCKI